MMNNKEIEYKILIDQIPNNVKNNIKPLIMEQFYFDFPQARQIITHLFNFELSHEGYVSRVRKTIYPDNQIKYILCLKTTGFIHNEYETEVTSVIYEQIKAISVLSIIQKKRYIDHFQNHTYEFDEFLNLGINHTTCEVEIQDNYISVEEVIKTLREHYKLKKVVNVTDDPRYQNVNLIKTFGYKK